MITKNFKADSFDGFIKKLNGTLHSKGYTVAEIRDVLPPSPLPFPKVAVLTVEKNGIPFRISIVYDRNGITATVVGLKDKTLESELKEILNSLP